MARWSLLVSLLSASFALGVVPLSSVKRVTNLPVVPNQYIIEVDTAANIPSKRSFTSPLHAIYEHLKTRDVALEVDKEYDQAGVFVGAAVTLQSADDVATILSTPGVKAIRPVIKYAAPKPVNLHVVQGKNDPQLPVDTESTHVLTGVNKLHAEGIFGQGIKIGVIDTGIDYTHPALGGGFGPGHKVNIGYDFVGNDYTGSNELHPGPDPMDCNGHGTHVAGIIGADPNNDFGISGVSYAATLAGYKVFGCAGSTTDAILVEALLRGVKDGQDILTLSIGGPDGWTEGTAAVVASRIASQGKIVTIAAGNEGASGSWYTSSPGNGINVISTASVDNTVVRLQNLTVTGVDYHPITYFSTWPLPFDGTLPLYATSKDITVPDDACNPLPDSTPDLSKYVVLIRRGSCNFVVKLANAAEKGAKIALIYDNGTGFNSISVGDYLATLIQREDGEYLATQLAAGASISVSFPQTGGSTEYPSKTGGLVSGFSTYGPSNDFFFKPAIAAPGGSILSTYPVSKGSFAVLSGTSMATPFVAGSAALLLQVNGKSSAVTSSARTLFQTTATYVGSTQNDTDPFQTVTQQGAGLINVYNALKAKTIVSPGELSLNDTAHFKPIQTFTVKNTGKSRKLYKLSHVPAGTALTIQADIQIPETGPVPLVSNAAKVIFVPPILSLGPGQSQTVIATFIPPSGLDKKTFPVYSGFIQVDAPGETYHITYQGLAASIKDKKIFDDSDYFFGFKTPVTVDPSGEVQTEPRNYTYVGDDLPALLYRLAFGTRSLKFDLVEANTTFVPTIGARGLFDHFPWITFPHPNGGGTFARVKTVGALAEFGYLPRNDEATDPDGTGWNVVVFGPYFANATVIPNGDYRILMRALRVTGDLKKEEDYDSYLSEVIGVRNEAPTTP